MQIIVTGKHLEITELLKKQIEDSFNVIFEDKTLKVSTIRVMVDFDKPRFRVDVMVALKQHEIAASAEDFDMYKALAEAADRVKVQVDKYLTKVQNHGRDSLRDLEVKAAEQAEQAE